MSDKATKPTVVDPATIEPRTKSVYPEPYAKVCDGREKQALGDAAGLTQFGVNLTRLKPGATSALRHWHVEEDEFIYILEGEATLITDAGEQVLGPGMARASRPARKTAITSSTSPKPMCSSSRSAAATRARWAITPMSTCTCAGSTAKSCSSTRTGDRTRRLGPSP